MTVLLLLGPTATGKSAVAGVVAEAVGAEVISADARAVYRGLEIGTDRPPPSVLARVPHHLVGVLDPVERYDAAAFRRDCERIVAEIHARGRRAVIVGGSTLYVRALTRGLFPGPAAQPHLREELARRPLAELHAELARVDPASAARIHPSDRVRIVRALEVHRLTGRPLSGCWGQERTFPFPLVKVALTVERGELHRRIEARVARMFDRGLVEEARRLWKSGVPHDAPAARTIGYQELFPFFAGEYDLDEARRRIVRNTKAYARRQLAFFRAESDVDWIDVTGRPVADVAGEVLARWRGAEG
ncbi:MAG: tRNA dimethylallyltransferase [Candidatus Bipolaricaulis sibiricus]|uniref:tRNA dimethylallyltransferase n=1 Tax=Bipolaricaulis sibiricus TaxID=2501609 RepID=A0A410FUG3_BIPS1|nr:MAG: tRNA dimethylallyltransferase [Candidatus Bipolaricaulis sibiricus]